MRIKQDRWHSYNALHFWPQFLAYNLAIVAFADQEWKKLGW